MSFLIQNIEIHRRRDFRLVIRPTKNIKVIISSHAGAARLHSCWNCPDEDKGRICGAWGWIRTLTYFTDHGFDFTLGEMRPAGDFYAAVASGWTLSSWLHHLSSMFICLGYVSKAALFVELRGRETNRQTAGQRERERELKPDVCLFSVLFSALGSSVSWPWRVCFYVVM